MHGHNKVEAVLDALQKYLAVVDIDVEFTFECVMYQDACFDVYVVILTVPVCLEGHWHAIPSLWVLVSQPVTHTLDNTLGQNSRLNKESLFRKTSHSFN